MLAAMLLVLLFTSAAHAAPAPTEADRIAVRIMADAGLAGGTIMVRADGGRWQTRGTFVGDGVVVYVAGQHDYEIRIEKSDLWRIHWGFSGLPQSDLSNHSVVYVHEEDTTLPNKTNIGLALTVVLVPMIGLAWLRFRRSAPSDGTPRESTLERLGFKIKSKTGRKVVLPDSGVIGPYQVHDLLGEGGSAAVYRVTDADGQTHAIKIPHAGACKDATFVKRFQREIAICMSLVHPNIIRAYDTGTYEADGLSIPYLVMEVSDGASLDQYVSERSVSNARPDLAFAVAVGLAVARALQEAHQRGIVHRDIKPSNVMIDRQHHIKVMDFGIARKPNQFTALTKGAIGTPTYMAPEQISDIGAVDARADLYALGTLLFILTTYDQPFWDEDLAETVKRKLSEPAPDVRDFNEEVGHDLAHLIGRLLERAPADRYQTATEVITALESVRIA